MVPFWFDSAGMNVTVKGILGLKLVTTDEPLVREFPSVAFHLRDFAVV
jgi:hypothetical protein